MSPFLFSFHTGCKTGKPSDRLPEQRRNRTSRLPCVVWDLRTSCDPFSLSTHWTGRWRGPEYHVVCLQLCRVGRRGNTSLSLITSHKVYKTENSPTGPLTKIERVEFLKTVLGLTRSLSGSPTTLILFLTTYRTPSRSLIRPDVRLWPSLFSDV